MKTVFTPIREWFEAYAGTFAEGSGKSLSPMLQLKYDHCHRVAQDAAQLARDLHWSADDVEIAGLLGLFHDVGRFSQYQEFLTFYDRVSINHADRGAEVFRACELTKGLFKAAFEAIHEGIRLHSRRFLQDDLPAEVLRFVHLIRDADKLDDFSILNDAIRRNDPQELKEIIWKLPVDAPPSPEVIRDLLEGRITSYDSLRSLADFNLIQLSWIFDINFAPTFRQIAERTIVDRIEEVMAPHASLPPVFAKVRRFLQERTAA